jgi:hypothetical protein
MSSPVIAPPASRNAPCPCGSGLRYKECHGAIAASTPASDPIALAQQSAAKGDRAAARKLCEQVLAATPDHPLALQLLAHGEYEVRRCGCSRMASTRRDAPRPRCAS